MRPLYGMATWNYAKPTLMYICFQCSSRYPIRVDFCSQCLDSGTVIIEPQQPVSNALQSLKVMSTRDRSSATAPNQ